MDSLKDFFDYLENMNPKKDEKASMVLGFTKEDLVEEKTEEFHDCTVDIKVFKSGNTTVTVEQKIPKNTDSGKTMWQEALESIIEDLDQEISCAVENEKFELAAELKQKRDFIKKKL
jgi:excinuclease UvrABC helicase subunit UvrB